MSLHTHPIKMCMRVSMYNRRKMRRSGEQREDDNTVLIDMDTGPEKNYGSLTEVSWTHVAAETEVKGMNWQWPDHLINTVLYGVRYEDVFMESLARAFVKINILNSAPESPGHKDKLVGHEAVTVTSPDPWVFWITAYLLTDYWVSFNIWFLCLLRE